MKAKGFTLIELLIVVAIIAILAAIAVPNFLEAQTRAKASRMKADMRSIATAMEAYQVDNNHYPFDKADDLLVPYYLHPGLSTPVAYMTNAARLRDIFAAKQTGNVNEYKFRIRYRDFVDNWLSNNKMGFLLPGNGAPGIERAKEVHGAWLLISKGPDGTNNPLPTSFQDGANANDWLWLQYDPTNGTTSHGEIMRSAKKPDVSAGGYPYVVTYPVVP